GTRSVVTGQVRATEPTRSGNFAPSTKVEQSRAVYVGRVGRDVLFSNMAMHRCVYEEIGNFDERLGPGSAYPGAEDNDLGFRMLEAGYRIIYLPDAVVYHRAWRPASHYLPL